MKPPSSSVPPQTATSVSHDNLETAEASTLRIDWNDWLEKVQALPSESLDWEDIPQFLEALQQLYENKQQERDERNTQRQRLQTALSNLTTQAEEILTFFEMRDISQWAVEACPLPHVATAVQLCEQLRFLYCCLSTMSIINGRPLHMLRSVCVGKTLRVWRKRLRESTRALLSCSYFPQEILPRNKK